MVELTHCPHCHKPLYPDLPEWAERVRALRKTRGLTQMQLATHLGTSIAAVQKWEAGINSPHERTRVKIEAMETAHYHER